MIKCSQKYIFLIALIGLLGFTVGCKHKKKTQQTAKVAVVADTLGKCRIDYKNGKSLTKHIKENELLYNWLFLKSNVTTLFEGEDKSFDAKVRVRKDSLMLITIELLTIDFGHLSY